MKVSENQIRWGDVNRFRRDVEKIVNLNENGFSAVVNTTNFFTALFPNQRKLATKEIMRLDIVDERKIKLKGNGRRIAPEVITDVGNEIVVISKRSRLFGTRRELFYNKIDPFNLSKVETGEEIINYYKLTSPVKKLMGASTSEDFSKAAAYYNIPVRNGDFQGYGYVLFNQSSGMYDKNTIQMPYVNFQFEISDHFIGNNGDFYTIGKEYYQTFPNRRWSLNNRFFAKSKIYKVSEGKFEGLEISQVDFVILEVKITTDENNNIVCSGFYGDNAMSGVRGVFTIHMDSETHEIISSKKVPFNQEFLSSGVAAWERSWRDRFVSQNTRQQGLHNFAMLDLRMTSEGDFIGNKKVLLVFNDNKWNYDDAGQFKYREFPRPMNLSKLWNVIGVVEIDLTTGQETGRMMPGRRDLNTVLIPGNCRFDYNNDIMYLHSKWGLRRNRFGKISLN